MANGDQVVGHHHIITQALHHATSEAFCPVKKRDIYNLDPQDTLLGELNPNYQGLLFPESSPESPDLESIMGDAVDPEVKQRIVSTVNQSLAINRDRVQVLDSTIRSLYTATSGLGNNGAETVRGFGQVYTALDIRQQSIIWRAGPYVKPTSLAKAKPVLKDKPISAPKEKRTRG